MEKVDGIGCCIVPFSNGTFYKINYPYSDSPVMVFNFGKEFVELTTDAVSFVLRRGGNRGNEYFEERGRTNEVSMTIKNIDDEHMNIFSSAGQREGFPIIDDNKNPGYEYKVSKYKRLRILKANKKSVGQIFSETYFEEKKIQFLSKAMRVLLKVRRKLDGGIKVTEENFQEWVDDEFYDWIKKEESEDGEDKTK